MFYRDGGSVGCANKYVEEDVKKGRLVITTLHPREYVVALDAMGNVDTEFRTYKLTLKQLKEKFGEDALKEDMPNFKQSFEKNPYEEKERRITKTSPGVPSGISRVENGFSLNQATNTSPSSTGSLTGAMTATATVPVMRHM